MKKINIILAGYGRVGQAFVRLIQEKQDYCHKRYDLHIRIGVILNSGGGLCPEEFPYWKSGFGFREALERRDLDILVDCTPSNLRDGEPALGYTHRALDRGWHVVTANKGPLVVDYDRIRKKAEKNRVSLGMSGATAAALPTLDVALHSLAGAEIHRIEGILNGTTNYVLTRMNEGMEYPVALKEAQEKGIAEPNPSQDVEGWDTAAKILIITNSIFGEAYSLKDIHVEGITHIHSEFLEEAKKLGKVIKLIGRFVQDGKTRKMETKISLIDPSHPLFGIDAAKKGIAFFTDTMDSVTVIGGKSDPRGAAAALLKDIINICMG